MKKIFLKIINLQKRFFLLYIFLYTSLFAFQNISFGFLGDVTKKGFYETIDQNYESSTENIFLYEASNHGDGNTAEAFNEGLKSQGINCNFVNYDEINSVLKNLSIEEISKRCTKNNDKLKNEEVTQIIKSLSERKRILLDESKQKLQVLNTISGTSVFADGNPKNAPFDIITDLEDIDREIFGEDIKKYEGGEDFLTSDIFKKINSVRNKNGAKNSEIEALNQKKSGYGSSSSSNSNSSSNNIFGNLSKKYNEDIIKRLNLKYKKDQNEDEDENSDEKNDNSNNINVDLACVDSSLSNLSQLDIYKAIKQAEEFKLTENLIPKQNNQEENKQENKTNTPNNQAVNNSNNNANHGPNSGSVGPNISGTGGSVTAIGGKNKSSGLNLNNPSGSYSSQKDKWNCEPDSKFCVKLEASKRQYQALKNMSYFSLQKVLATHAYHLKKTNETSLIQSKKTINNFELGLIVPNLSQIMRGFGIEVQWKPIPNLDKIQDKNTTKPWGKDRLLENYFKHSDLDYKKQNSIAVYEDLEEQQAAFIDSLGMSIDSIKTRMTQYEYEERLNTKKSNDIQMIAQQRNQFELRSDILDQISELDKFVNYVWVFTEAVMNEIDQMKKIPIRKP